MDDSYFNVEKLIMESKFKASQKEKKKNKLVNIAQKVHIGERLTTVREELGMSQEKWGEQFNKTREEISRYESGINLTLDYIITVSKKTNKPLFWFFETNNETKRRENAQEWFEKKGFV